MTARPELEFFNGLSGRLVIELSEPPLQVAPGLLNVKAAPTARITGLRLEVAVIEGERDRDVTQEELASVAFAAPRLALRGDTGEVVAHDAPNGSHFTVLDLIRAIEETERQTRGGSDWLGGVDIQHVYFEGLFEEEDGTWSIGWGS